MSSSMGMMTSHILWKIKFMFETTNQIYIYIYNTCTVYNIYYYILLYTIIYYYILLYTITYYYILLYTIIYYYILLYTIYMYHYVPTYRPWHISRCNLHVRSSEYCSCSFLDTWPSQEKLQWASKSNLDAGFRFINHIHAVSMYTYVDHWW